MTSVNNTHSPPHPQVYVGKRQKEKSVEHEFRSFMDTQIPEILMSLFLRIHLPVQPRPLHLTSKPDDKIPWLTRLTSTQIKYPLPDHVYFIKLSFSEEKKKKNPKRFFEPFQKFCITRKFQSHYPSIS